jgi:hypothetical protein
MAKETTLNEIGEMLTHVVKHMATKEDIRRRSQGHGHQGPGHRAAHAGQLNRDAVRGMEHVKLQSRVADLEEEVFGAPRA